jgi:hypothetical protein
MRASLDWRESGAGVGGRPALRGASGRKVDFSRAATKAGDPSGRPVWVERATNGTYQVGGRDAEDLGLEV